jgi:aryl-alcohol dehydrogenase-like predicted oxidoreductase
MLATLPFGRTGHHSSRVVFGAAALGAMSQERADATLDLAFGRGINHIDTAASYGESELRLRPFLTRHRADVFLATKTGERTGGAARRELERSLERMGVDHVDLIQLHNLVEPDEWEIAHGPGGAVEAMVRARDEGLVRFIGVTGHGTRIAGMHLRSLERFAFDSVLCPCNPLMLAHPVYGPAFDDLVALCAERGAAVQVRATKGCSRVRGSVTPGRRGMWSAGSGWRSGGGGGGRRGSRPGCGGRGRRLVGSRGGCAAAGG